MDRSKFQTRLRSNDSGSCVSVHGDLQGSRVEQSYDYPKRNNRNKCYRYYKYLPAIVSLFFACPSYAETVGGVSATASPIANSSGSVTNQAIQVLQGPYITNTYGGGIQCQGATLNITPFITGSGSFQSPYEPYYNDPVYGELIKAGIMFRPGTQYAKICQDVMVTNPGGVIPQHVHSIPSPSTSESRGSESAAVLGGPLQIRR